MDKSWMEKVRYTQPYIDGVQNFIQFAITNSARGNAILCPCRKCLNCSWKEVSVVHEHLVCDGFLNGYKRWIYHGEASSSLPPNSDYDDVQAYDVRDENNLEEYDEMSELIRDMGHEIGDLADSDGEKDPKDHDADAFRQFIGDASEELYPGCTTFSKLRFVVRLLYTKSLGGWSDKSFDMLLELLKEAFPKGSKLPKNFHEANKMVKCLQLGCVNIHACENDCILFWKQHENEDSCPKCETSRWKSEKKNFDGKRVHKVPRKVLRYFPIKKRLQRMLMSPKSATDCRWHDEEHTRDWVLRHPADSPAWKDFDGKHPEFAAESRNIRLVMAIDGFNPFRSLNCAYSIWPVIAIPLNLPPWLCMKQPNFILSLLIPGPKSPGKDIDVFLQPLVNDLDALFEEGVRTYDASKVEYFQLHAAVMSTTSDLPGLATLSACVTLGEFACPHCHSHTCSLWLNKGKKTCYMGHRRFLDANHQFRSDDKTFDGTMEFRPAHVPLTGEEVLALTENMKTIFGKDPSGKRTTRKRKRGEPAIIQKRRSIWFRLRYWKDLLQPHNFDVMHIEKNVCDNIINTRLGIDRKSKENLNSSLDLQLLGIREDLHPIEVGGSIDLPAAPYSMSPQQKKLFCEVLKHVKFLDGYASDIRRHVHVKEKKIIGLKSHDNHILLQHFLPLAVRRTLPEGVSVALIRISRFFQQIYSPVIHISDMEKLEAEITETLSILETIFLPSFFDIMVHLMVHLPTQVRIGGPVKYSNMYPIERFLMKLKGYVCTKSHPEGSIAEGYLFDESLTFCSRYLQGCENRFNRKYRTDVPDPNSVCSTMPFFSNKGRYLAGKRIVTLDHRTWLQAHRYVLFNYDNIDPYLRKHTDYLSSIGHRTMREISRIHHEKFREWFRLHVAQLVESGEEVSEEIRTLTSEPLLVARKYSRYTINGYNFHTKSYDEGRPIQSSGVSLDSQISSFTCENVEDLMVENKTYYGVITEILELDYHQKGNIVLFKCDWVDNRVQDKWVKVDKFGITNVNFKHLFNRGEKLSDEPFILASQATQVYYVEDPHDRDWCAVRTVPKPRDLYDMFAVGNEILEQGDEPAMGIPDSDANVNLSVDVRDIPRIRTDIDGTLIPAMEQQKKKNGLRRRRKR